MNRRIILVAWVALTGAAAQAPAQEPARASDAVYRCGADGRQYRDSPCPEGKEVSAADGRSAEQRRQAKAVAERDKELAERLKAEREQREKSIKPAAAGHIGPVARAPAPSASAPKKSKPPRKPKKPAKKPSA